MKILRFDRLDSTNLYAKRLQEDAIVIAREQTAGRGTKGRSFSSAPGGLYLTKLVHAELPAASLFRIAVNASVAVCRTAEAFGLTPSIKWPNDVLIRGRKVCGILIENVCAGDRVIASLVGIGVNVNNPLPASLAEIATSFSLEAGMPIDLDRAEATLLSCLEGEYTLEAYRAYLRFVGARIKVLVGGEEREGIARGVDEIGRLLVEEDGKLCAYAAAEVSLRL